MENDNFCITKNYTPQNNPQYFHDLEPEAAWQQNIYKLAHQIGTKHHCKYIIDIGAGNGYKLKKFVPKFSVIAIDFGDNIDLLKKNLPKQKIIKYNLEDGIPNIDKKILLHAVVVCADVVEHVKNPSKLFSALADLSKVCPLTIISTPDRVRIWGKNHMGPPPNPAHVREWTADEMAALLKKNKFNHFLIGHVKEVNYNNQFNTLCVVTGTTISHPTNDIFQALNKSEMVVYDLSLPAILVRKCQHLIAKIFINSPNS